MSGVYLIDKAGQLVEMREQAYDSEALLQKLLADYPSLLSGEETDGAPPRRWLLVTREAPVGVDVDSGARWSVDHLFLDDEGVPTLVEVKRSSDTRIRREVVGQMLDYAANGIIYWPVDKIRELFAASCEKQQADAEAALESFLGPEGDPDEFWERVGTNLQAGKVRLLFVADMIPVELRRVVEFLNKQMSQTEVLAIEIRQFVGKDLTTLVPRVIGQTAEAQQRKTGAPRQARQWNEDSLLAEIESRRSRAEADAAREVIRWAEAEGLRLWWGRGSTWGSVIPVLDHGGRENTLVAVWTGGNLELRFQYLRNSPPFDRPEMRAELAKKLNEIPGVSLPPDAIERLPSLALSRLTNDEAMGRFRAALNWAVEEIRASSQVSAGMR